MKKVLIFILYSFFVSVYGQKVDTVYISTLNFTKGTKIVEKNANLYFGYKNVHFTDFCFLKDSCLIIHDTQNNSVLLVDKNCSVIDQFKYTKKIRRLKYEYFPTLDNKIQKSPLWGNNSNISYINDTTVFVSTIKKGDDFKLFYLTIKNNKLNPIFIDLNEFAPLFGKSSIDYAPMITNVFSDKELLLVSYLESSFDGYDSIVGNLRYGQKETITIAGVNKKTKDTLRISKTDKFNDDGPFISTNFGSSYLVLNNLYKKLYQFDQNLNYLDSLSLSSLGYEIWTMNILSDIATDKKYLVLKAYNKSVKSYEYPIFEIQAGLSLRFVKNIRFDQKTEIKTINNGTVYFPYINNEDFKYYIFNLSLTEKSQDNLFVTYKDYRPPIYKNISVTYSQSNLWEKNNDFFMGMTIDDFTMMKRRERKLFPFVERNTDKYPQSTIKELLESILLASDSSDFNYIGQHLTMYEKDDYKIRFEKHRDAIKKGIEDGSIFNYSENEMVLGKNKISTLLANMGSANIEENKGLTIIEFVLDEESYVYVFIKVENKYYISYQCFKKKCKNDIDN